MIGRFETFTVLIAKISKSIRKLKNVRMAEYDLRGPQVSIIYYLYSKSGVTATDLCELCKEDKATVSRALCHLEEAGYIKRDNCKNRYKSAFTLTEAGESVGKKAVDIINSILEEIGRELTEEERIELYSSLERISDSLERISQRFE